MKTTTDTLFTFHKAWSESPSKVVSCIPLLKQDYIKNYAIFLLTGENEEEMMQLCERMYKDIDLQQISRDFSTTWDEFFTGLTICNTVVVSSQPEIISDTLETSADFTFGEDERASGERHLSLPNNSLHNEAVSAKKQLPRSNTMDSPLDVTIDAASPTTANGSVRFDDSGIDYLTTERRVRVFSNVISDRLSRSIGSINSWLNYGLVPNYEYESPDEGALVKAASQYNYKLANRTPEQIFFTTPNGEIKVYDILQVLAFDSDRKRMSIIVRDDLGQIKLYCKGADTSILSRLSNNQGMIFTYSNDDIQILSQIV